MSELRITGFEQAAIDKQRTLFRECFPETLNTSSETVAHYQWKFHSFPAARPSYEYAAFLGDEMVGYYAALPYTYLYQDKKITAGMVCDVMTGVAARGKGVFTKIGIHATRDLQEQGLAFTTGYPIRPEVIPGHMKAGWEVIFDLPLYARPLTFKTLFKNKKLGALAPLADLAHSSMQRLLRLFFLKKAASTSFEIIQPNEIEKAGDFLAFLQAIPGEVPIALEKNKDFLKWRLGAPSRHYDIVIMRQNGRITGYGVVTMTTRMNVPCLGILDLYVLKERRADSLLLLERIRKLAEEKKAELVLVMMSAYMAQQNGLAKAGFFKTPYKFKLIIKQLHKVIGEAELKRPENWNLMWIDCDDL